MVDDPRWNTQKEQRLLLWAATPRAVRPGLPVESLEEIDWVHFRRLAQRNRVMSPAAEALQGFEEWLPERERAPFQEVLRLNAARSLRVTTELLGILAAFGQRGIAAMPLKGASLAQRLYGNVALRDCGDVDLLVDPSEVVPAVEVLRSLGYVGEGPIPNLRWIQARGDEYHYTCSKPRCSAIELHWALDPVAYRCPVRPEDLLRSERSFQFGACIVRCPDPTEELLFLCVHGGKHQWSELRWVGDIAHFLLGDRIADWDGMLRLAKARGGRRAVLLGVNLAAELLQRPLPNPLADALRTEAPLRRMVREATVRLLAPELPEESRLARWRYHIDLRDSWADRAHYVGTSLSLLTAGKLREMRAAPRRVVSEVAAASAR